MAARFSSVFDQVYSPPGTIRRDVLRNMRLGNRDAQILEFLRFCEEYGIQFKAPPAESGSLERASGEAIKNAVARRFKITPDAAAWYIYFKNAGAMNFRDKIEAQNYFRDHMLRGQRSSGKMMKDNQLHEFTRLIVAAIGPRDVHQINHAAVLERVYAEFLIMDPKLMTGYGWGLKFGDTYINGGGEDEAEK